jgi:hypothetical protein
MNAEFWANMAGMRGARRAEAEGMRQKDVFDQAADWIRRSLKFIVVALIVALGAGLTAKQYLDRAAAEKALQQTQAIAGMKMVIAQRGLTPEYRGLGIYGMTLRTDADGWKVDVSVDVDFKSTSSWRFGAGDAPGGSPDMDRKLFVLQQYGGGASYDEFARKAAEFRQYIRKRLAQIVSEQAARVGLHPAVEVRFVDAIHGTIIYYPEEGQP